MAGVLPAGRFGVASRERSGLLKKPTKITLPP